MTSFFVGSHMSQPPAPPPPPAKASAPDAAPLRAQVAVLRERASNLRSEREDLVSQLSDANGNAPATSALTGRLAEVEKQLTQTESALRSSEDRLAALGVGPDGERFTETGVAVVPRSERDQNSNDIPDNLLAVIIVSILFVGMPVAVGISRWIWKRSTTPKMSSTATLPAAEAQRLARMEQAIDAMAVELERISEGQRFVTRVLAEDRALPAGAAAPMPVPVRQPDEVARS